MSPSQTGPSSISWERGTARVLHDGRPVGGAFLIPGRLMLTCSHVVSAIAGRPETEPLPADFPVTLDFPLLPGHPAVAATVQFSVPVAADNSGDVAVLRLVDPPPAGAVPLRIVEADDLAGHRWRAFGFPRFPGPNGSKDAGIWTRGTVEGREATGWWQLTCDEQAGFPLAGGFSGAPVWDEEYQGVIGVVVAVEGDQRRRTGYALTVESLARDWPQLRVRLLADSPFRELLPFAERDSAVFHGREHETNQLLDLLVEQQVPVLPVLGASGVGKSSLTGAGLLARLEGDAYLIARVPHGLRLTAEELLAWALASAGDADPTAADWHDRWSALARQLGDEHGLRTALERTLARHDPRCKLLVVVDQFESLLADAPETARKLDTMLGVLTARRPDGRRSAQAVIVARIDFLPLIEQLPVLRAAWEATHVVVPSMTREQLHTVITRPLEGHPGIRFADGLVQQLLHDTPYGAAALPLLEYTLSQLWARRERGLLTATAYRELGGVQGALVGTVERTLWQWADNSEHEALERIFIQLVRPAEELDAGERGPDTRRVADRTQFSEDDWSLIHRLASTRLVVVTRRPTGLDTAELAHQALVEGWPRLQDWVERNRDFRRWQEELRRSLRAWQEQGRPADLTLDRRRVELAKRWLGTRGSEVFAEEAEFIDASVAVQRRRVRRRRLAMAGFSLLAVLALVMAGVAVLNAQTGNRQRDLAAAEQLVTQSQLQADTDPALAARLALAAQRIDPTAESRARLLATLASPMRATLTGHTGPLHAVAFSPDGSTLATGADDGTARLWDVRTRAQLATLTGQSGQVSSVAFSPDGRILATSDGAVVRLWDVQTHQQLVALKGAESPVLFSPDGSTLVTGAGQGAVRLWDVRTLRPLATITAYDSSSTLSVAFSRDGRTLAIAGSGGRTVQLWDVGSRSRLATLPGDTGLVQSVAFSPDGNTVATGGNDSAARLWDVRTHKELAVLAGQSNTVFSLAFSPDGQTLVTGSYDQTVWLWDVRTHRALLILTGHTGSVNSLAFSPDGNTLATGSADATARLWDMRVSRPLATFPAQGSSGRVMAYSPKAEFLAVANGNNTVLWDAQTHHQLATLTGHTGNVQSVVFSPDGSILATGSDDKTIRLWDVQTRHPLAVLTGTVWSMAFSPDGNTLATGSYVDGTVRLWDVRTHRLLATLTGHTLAGSFIFSPDGKTLATTSDDKTTSLWDVRTHRLLATLTGHTAAVTSMAFSPDGKTLATASWDNTVRLWDVQAHRLLAVLTGHTGNVQSVAFSPDGAILASSGRDNTVRLWDVQTRHLLAVLTSHTGIVWSVVFSPDGSTLASSSDDGTVRLWDVRARRLLAVLTGHTGIVWSVVFSPDGSTLASSSDDGTVRLWSADIFDNLGIAINQACVVAGRSITPREWQQYVPAAVAYRQICP